MFRILRPSSVRTGIFCKFGPTEDKRPVAATVCAKWVRIRPSEPISAIRPSTVVPSFLVSRIRNSDSNKGCLVFSKSQLRASASVVNPVLIFLVFGRFNSSNRTTWSCLGDATLNSWPAAKCAALVSRATSPSKKVANFSNSLRSTAMPRFSITAKSWAIGSSRSTKSGSTPRSRISVSRDLRKVNKTAALLNNSCSGEDESIVAPSPHRSRRSLNSWARTPGLTRYAAKAVSKITPSSKFSRANVLAS